MQTEIIRIGDSRGLRLPDAMLQQCGIGTRVNIHVSDHILIITPCKELRAGWKQSFKVMHQKGDDHLLDPEAPPSAWDDKDWQW